MFDFASKLVIVSGPSGAGKDSIVAKLLEKDESFSLAVSATTRSPRGEEENGVHYYFFDKNEFVEKIENNEFVEYAKYGSNYYGTLKADVENRIRNGKTVILVIEVNGACNIRKMYPGVLSVFIMPPSEQVLEARLRKRSTDSEADILKRLSIAKTEITESCNYDYTVVNSDLDDAVEEVYNIIKSR